jgi:hypothetical protein
MNYLLYLVQLFIHLHCTSELFAKSMVKYLVKEAPASFFLKKDLKKVIVLFTIIDNLFIFTKLTKLK